MGFSPTRSGSLRRRFPLALAVCLAAAAVTLLATNLSDNFDTDPLGGTPRWTVLSGTTPAYDATDDEWDLDMATQPIILRYDTTSGSLECEAQVTFLPQSNPNADGIGGPAVRLRNDTTREGYFAALFPGASVIRVYRYYDDGGNAAWVQVGTDIAFTNGYTDWISIRLAASGTVGSNVTLDVWATNHGGTKPASDPGWQGTDNSPLATRTDSDAARADAADNAYGGVGSLTQGFDFDTRHDYWKARAISDRSGATPARPRLLLVGVGE